MWLTAVLLTLAVVVSFGMFLGSQIVGATWDERIHAVMLTQYFDNGWYASPDWLIDGEPSDKLGDWPYFVYAPVTELLLHVFAAVGGAEPWGGFADTAAAYQARHLGTAFIALVGVCAAALTVKVITHSWRWGIVGAALLASVPMWIGHGMFNVKDLPVGTGYTLATLALVAALSRSQPNSRKLRALTWLSLVSGLVLAIGTRPASGLPMVGAAILFVVGAPLLRWQRRQPLSWLPKVKVRVFDVVGSLTIAYLLLLIIYPRGFANPFTLAKETLAISGRFPVNDAVLTNGVWLEQPVPWTYLPTWFAAQLPLLITAGSLGFVVFWLLFLIRDLRKSDRSNQLEAIFILAIPILLQAFALPMMAILFRSTMYNAVRQFLFVVPALTILATLFLVVLVRWMNQRGLRRALQATWIVVLVGVIAPVAAQIQLFPYAYTYYNVVAATEPIDGRWSTDYWRASGPELTRIVPAEGLVSCDLIDDSQEAALCEVQPSFEPYWGDRGAEAPSATLGEGEYWFVRTNGGDITIPEQCTLHDTVTRRLWFQEPTIAQVLRCST